jgi:hypothetical protein
MLAALAVPARADVIDRLMAVVAGTPIMLSDVNAAVALGIVPPPAQPGRLIAPLNALISRTLILIEVDRYQPPEPAAGAVDARLAVYERNGGTAADRDRLLASVGWTRQTLRRVARDDLRIQTYLDQRFAAAAQPSDAEVAAYYREHQERFTQNGAVQPLAGVADAIRAQLTADRRAQLIREWVAGLRERVDVAVPYVTDRAQN